MKIKNERGIKWISCDNLGELVKEFKEFRATEIATGKKREWNDYSFLQMSRIETIKGKGEKRYVGERIDEATVYQQDGVNLSLNLVPLNLKEKQWIPYRQKVEKILKEIWENGEAKNYQGLDLNWPVHSKMMYFCDQCHKCIGDNRKSAWFNDVEKNLDFCSEICHHKFKKNEEENKELKEQLRKEINHKNIWIIVSILLGISFAFTILFCWLKIKRVKKH